MVFAFSVSYTFYVVSYRVKRPERRATGTFGHTVFAWRTWAGQAHVLGSSWTVSMTPTRPGEKPEISDREKRIIEQRLATFDDDRTTAVDARQALASIRKKLKHAAPR